MDQEVQQIEDLVGQSEAAGVDIKDKVVDRLDKGRDLRRIVLLVPNKGLTDRSEGTSWKGARQRKLYQDLRSTAQQGMDADIEEEVECAAVVDVVIVTMLFESQTWS